MVHKNELVYKDNVVSQRSQINIRLGDRDLWMRFFGKTNEMIVTRSGRNMFPVIKVDVSGLDPTTIYEVVVDFQQINNHKWKYINGEWQQGTKPDPVQLKCEYKHPDSPNFGSHWMKDSLSFNKVKLTNKPPNKGQIQLNSLHKYEPRIVIYRLNTNMREKIAEASFHETQFIAVTAYQNEEITSLKIRHNPFAKAFLDVRESRPEREQNGPHEEYLDEAQTYSTNLYGFNNNVSNSLVTVAPNHLQSNNIPASSISSSTSSSPESNWSNNQSYAGNNLTPNSFFVKEEHKGYSLPCPQNQHSGGHAERSYNRHSSARSNPYSTSSSCYYTPTLHQIPLLNYSQEIESQSNVSPPLIVNSQFSSNAGVSPNSNNTTNNQQQTSQANIESSSPWSPSASTSPNSSSLKANESSLSTSSPSTLSSNSSPVSNVSTSGPLQSSQFFNPTTSSSPLNQQNISYSDIQSYQPHNGKYWSSLNMTQNNYNTNYLNQHHHNYALAALAAAKYHPQISIPTLNHLGHNSNYSQNEMKPIQYNSVSPMNNFYDSNNQGPIDRSNNHELNMTHIETSHNHNDSGFESPKATNFEPKINQTSILAIESSPNEHSKLEDVSVTGMRRVVWNNTNC